MANRSSSNATHGFLQAGDPAGRHITDPSGANLRDPETGKSLGGRPKGSQNQITSEARNFALSIVRSPEYRKSLLDRTKAGTLPPNIEAMLWAYAYGKPTERLEVKHISPAAQFAEMPLDQLAERAQIIARVLKEVGDLEATEQALQLVDQADEARQLAIIDAEILERVSAEKVAAAGDDGTAEREAADREALMRELSARKDPAA